MGLLCTTLHEPLVHRRGGARLGRQNRLGLPLQAGRGDIETQDGQDGREAAAKVLAQNLKSVPCYINYLVSRLERLLQE